MTGPFRRSVCCLRSGRLQHSEEGQHETPTQHSHFSAILGLFAGAAQAAESIKLGVMGGSEEEIAEVAQKVAAQRGLDVDIVTFSDYLMPNAALADGDLNANAFQHVPYLDAQKAARGYDIVPVGATIVEPMGMYSEEIKTIDSVKPGARIGIPNDPTNGGRALLLLAAHGLISLREGSGPIPTVLDVAGNPKNLKLSELDAALLPRALGDLDAAVINTNFALDAGLDPRKNAIIREPRVDNPYSNVIAVRAEDKDAVWVKDLVAAYQSDAVAQFLEKRFKGAIEPAWGGGVEAERK
jgi:D-methionine transport system substrate-binding protein